MKKPLLDTNVMVRFLVETPSTVPEKFKGVYPFFKAVECGDKQCVLTDVVVMQCYFVLTSYYEVPHRLVIAQLSKLCLLRGIHLQNKVVMMDCLQHLLKKKTDFVDAYLAAYSRKLGVPHIYSFDGGFEKMDIELLPIE